MQHATADAAAAGAAAPGGRATFNQRPRLAQTMNRKQKTGRACRSLILASYRLEIMTLNAVTLWLYMLIYFYKICLSVMH